MATSRRTGTNENISTFGGAGLGRDYTSIATWEADTDNDLVTATQSEVLEMYDDESFNETCDGLGGATTNSSYFRILRPESGSHHNGVLGAGILFDYDITIAGNGRGIYFNEDYFQIQDIHVTGKIVSTTASTIVLAVTENSWIIGCAVYDFEIGNSGGYSIPYYTYAASTATTGYINCMAVNINCSSGSHAWIFYNGSNTDTYCYNCVAENITGACSDIIGFRSRTPANADSYTLKNVIAQNIEDNCIYGVTGTTTIDGDIDTNAKFIDSINNFYEPSRYDTEALSSGTDLSADGTFAFDDDIAGNTRTNWDIGAYYGRYTLASGTCRRTGTNENITTYGSGGNNRDYTSLDTWEAATDNDLVTATQSEVLEVFADAEYSDLTTLTGATTNASYYRIIRGATGHEPDGEKVNGTTHAFFNVSSGTDRWIINLQEDYAVCSDIAVEWSSADAVSSTVYGILCATDCGGQLISGNVVHDVRTNYASGETYGIVCQQTGTNTSYVVNNIIVQHTDSANPSGHYMLGAAGGTTVYAYNNTIFSDASSTIAAAQGIFSSASMVAKNNILYGTYTANQYDSSSGSYTNTTNETGDATVFINGASNDFMLDSTDTASLGQGTDLSADGTFPFEDDVAFTAISTWNIGAFTGSEVAAEGSAIPVFWHHYSKNIRSG